MAEFSKLVITKKGQELIAKMIEGSENVKFTKIRTSNSTYQLSQLENLTVLSGVQQTSDISKITRTNGVAIKVETAFTNTELKAGYYIKAIGLYANDPQDNEILYAVTIETSGNCYMPPYNGITVSGAFIQLVTTVGNAESVSLSVSPGAVAKVGDIQELQQQIADLQAMIGYTDADIYGVEVDLKNKKVTRLAGAVDKAAGTGFDSVHCFGGRRRCNVTDAGKVVAYQGDAAFTTGGKLIQLAGGEAVGTKVQVMVEQPKFWYKVVPLETDVINEGSNQGRHMRKARYYVSPQPKDGFKVHPAFIANGEENDFIYLAAFEACVEDAETGYVLDDAAANPATDKLSSIARAKPASGANWEMTRANTRKMAEKRGTGWEQSYAATLAASQLLMLVEYASFDMQKNIGNGNSSKSDDSKTNMSELTGATVTLGNKSGEVQNGNGIKLVSYRGEENLWGDIWTWVDGLNEENPTDWSSTNTDGKFTGKHGRMYVADHKFADNSKADPYKDTGICPIYSTGGYISAFGYNEEFDWLFLPTEIAGNSTLPVGDYFWNYNSGWRVAIFGGHWYNGAHGGAFCLTLHDAASYRDRGVGGRLVYVPKGHEAA